MLLDYRLDRDRVVSLLRNQLGKDDARFMHSRGVEDLSIELAKRYGVDPDKAGLAGLVHDIAKHMDHVKLRHKYGLASPTDKTLHGQIGAAWLFENGYVEDEDVLNAIRYHTTGREAMSSLEKIVYLADVAEPRRTMASTHSEDRASVEHLRSLMEKDLDEAMLYALRMSIQHVLNKGGSGDRDELEKIEAIDPYTVEAYNFFRRRLQQKKERSRKAEEKDK